MAFGHDPRLFWRTTLREIEFIMRGTTDRLQRERNERMSLAWHTANLTAYAPRKPRDFPRLESLVKSDAKTATNKPAWRDVYAKAQGWAGKKKTRNA